MSIHIGLIGGIGPAATEHYYRALVREHASHNVPLHLTISHADTRIMIENMMTGRTHAQAQIFSKHAQSLKSAGCDLVVITSLGGHFCVSDFELVSPLPVVNIVPVLHEYLKKRGVQKLGLMGTQAVMSTGVYHGLSDIECLVPDGASYAATHDAYLEIAKTGSASEDQKRFFFDTGRKLCADQGADAVLLAGTDLFLAFEGENPDFPVLDAALIHAHHLFNLSTGHAKL